MNAKTWPAALPVPTLASSQGQIDFGYVNSGMESGLLRQRQRHSAQPMTKTLSVVCNKVEHAILYAFLSDLRGASFDVLTSVPGDPENDRQTVSARFLGNLSIANSQGPAHKTYSLPVFIERVQPVLTTTDALYVYSELSGDFDDYAQRVEDMTNSAPAG